MFFNRSIIAAWTLMLLSSSPLWAHPGHGASEPDSVLHYLIEPSHGLWVILLGALVAARWVFLRSRSMETVRTKANEDRPREE